MVELNSFARDFKLKGIDGLYHSLNDYKESPVLVIVFMCNHCPYVQKIWDQLIGLAGDTKGKVQFIGINSNANSNYPEDSFEKMKEYAELKGQNFPYLYDEDQKVALEYEAVCTPDIFVYDKERKLKYRGSFDNLKGAIEKILSGEKVENQIHSMGCSIKWN